MTWHRKFNDKGEEYAVWSVAYPGHHGIVIEFNLQELKHQLGLFEITEEVQ